MEQQLHTGVLGVHDDRLGSTRATDMSFICTRAAITAVAAAAAAATYDSCA